MNKTEKIKDLQQRSFAWPIPWEAVELIAGFEDCRLDAYLCPAKIPTIGWGETVGVRMGMKWTKEQADTQFFNEICQYADEVQKMCVAYTSDFQLGAFVSLAYNIGKGAFKKSTVLKAHNAGDTSASSRAFHLWNKARVNGVLVELPGLTARRAVESALYLRQDPTEYHQPNVQAVEAESSLVNSPINKAGAAGIATGGLTLASQFADGLAPIVEKAHTFSTALSINPLVVIGTIVLVTGGSSVYWRYKQRSSGWA